jgi:S-phase kinase-associated protein 1
VKGATLAKIIEYCERHHKDPPVPDVPDEYRTDNISEWDKNFIDVPMPLLFDIVLAVSSAHLQKTRRHELIDDWQANYLEVKGLLQLCCKNIANMIKGKNPEQIKETFRIPTNNNNNNTDNKNNDKQQKQ